MENESAGAVLADAYFRDLATRGVRLTNYYAVAHPSQPNYIAMVAGATLVDDDGAHSLAQSNIVDLLDAAGVSWKAYQEEFPGNCFNGGQAGNSKTGLYARKHNPFISFSNIRSNPNRCARIVPGDALDADLAAGSLPRFAFYTPNMNHDGHDRPLREESAWLKGFLDPKLADPRFADGTLVVVTFDEGDGTPATDPLYTVLLGPMVQAGSSDPTRYTHGSLLRTVEDLLGLGSLGRADANATPFASCNFSGGCRR
jgi:phospholipase C